MTEIIQNNFDFDIQVMYFNDNLTAFLFTIRYLFIIIFRRYRTCTKLKHGDFITSVVPTTNIDQNGAKALLVS